MQSSRPTKGAEPIGSADPTEIDVLGGAAGRARFEQQLIRERALLRCLIDSIPDLIFFKDEHGVYLGANLAYEARTGVKLAELPGRTDHDLFTPEEAAFYRTKDREMMASGRALRVEELVVHADGRRQWFDTLKTPYHGPEGQVLGLVGIARDVTESKLAAEQARVAATVFENAAEAILVTDAHNRILAVNPAFVRITGWSLEEIVGKDPSVLQSGRHDRSFYQELWRRLTEDGRWEGEIWNRRKNGEVFPEILSIRAVRDEAGAVVQHVAVFLDITRRKAREELIWHQANFDALTDLPNRNLFLDRLSRAAAAARRDGGIVGLLFLDLDHFKWVNDSLGHSTGDQLLCVAAERIRACVRDEDTVSRLGGDEFTVVLAGAHQPEDFEVVARKILESVAAPFHLGGHQIYVTASIGITAFPFDGDDPESLLRNADIAMYAAKEGGRNGWRFFQPAMNARAVERVRMERSLRAALEHGEFVLHYHPIVDLRTDRAAGVEALLRWNHPDVGLVAPGSFIPLAEETGLINPIGEWVLATAVEQLGAWIGGGFPLHVAVNVSSRQWRDERWVRHVYDVVTAVGLDPGALVLEITESLLMEDLDRTRDYIRAVKDMGVRISVDDFGTGYSSLSYLRRFPVDILKIDRSFLVGIEGDAPGRQLVRAIVDMAHGLGSEVVAEGVETPAQLGFLREIGCDYGQGFHFTQPLARDPFGAWMRDR